LGRWNLFLNFYTYRVEHVKEKNIVANRLSRKKLPTGDTEIDDALDDMVTNINVISDRDDNDDDGDVGDGSDQV